MNLGIKLIVGLVALAVLVMYGIAGITNVRPGFTTLQVKMLGSDRGINKETVQTGTHWIDPLMYDIISYDARIKQYSEQTREMTAETKDGQPVILDVSLEIGLTAADIPILHNTVGPDWFEQLVLPRARAAIRNAVSSQYSDVIYTSEGRTAITRALDTTLAPLKSQGINAVANIRDLKFKNQKFVDTLEEKASAAQREEIERRQALAAAQAAIKVANVAEGQKQKVIKEAEASKIQSQMQGEGNKLKRVAEAEAQREELRLEGEGERLKQEEMAKGILAVAIANAEGTRLQVNAYGSGATYASTIWAQNLAPKLQVFGVPTGANGTTSILDLSGALSGISSLKDAK